jgi:hypothetical protein
MLLEPSITKSTVGVTRVAVTCADAHTFEFPDTGGSPEFAVGGAATKNALLPEVGMSPSFCSAAGATPAVPAVAERATPPARVGAVSGPQQLSAKKANAMFRCTATSSLSSAHEAAQKRERKSLCAPGMRHIRYDAMKLASSATELATQAITLSHAANMPRRRSGACADSAA